MLWVLIPVCCRKWLKAEIGKVALDFDLYLLPKVALGQNRQKAYRRCAIVRYGIAENSLGPKSAKERLIKIATICRKGL